MCLQSGPTIVVAADLHASEVGAVTAASMSCRRTEPLNGSGRSLRNTGNHAHLKASPMPNPSNVCETRMRRSERSGKTAAQTEADGDLPHEPVLNTQDDVNAYPNTYHPNFKPVVGQPKLVNGLAFCRHCGSYFHDEN